MCDMTWMFAVGIIQFLGQKIWCLASCKVGLLYFDNTVSLLQQYLVQWGQLNLLIPGQLDCKSLLPSP